MGTRTWIHAAGTVHILLGSTSMTEHMLGTRDQRMVRRAYYACIGICVFTPAHSQCYTLGSKETSTVHTRAFTYAGGTVHILLVSTSMTQHMLGTRGQHMVTRAPYAWIGICVFTPPHSQCYTLGSKEMSTVHTRAFTYVVGTVHILLVSVSMTQHMRHQVPLPSTERTQTNTLSKGGCMCYRPAHAMLYPWHQEDIDCMHKHGHMPYVQCISSSRQRV